MPRRPDHHRNAGFAAVILYTAVLIVAAGAALVGYLKLKSDGDRREAQIARLDTRLRALRENNRKLVAQVEELTSFTAVMARLPRVEGLGPVPPDMKRLLPEPQAEPPLPLPAGPALAARAPAR
ncbi:MAG: hypothetical protein ACKVYV_13625 [Limisphaerales bacterium]